VSLAGAGLTLNWMQVANAHAGGTDLIRVGLIGCGSPRGGRGRGAAENCVLAGPNVRLMAMADLFADHLEFTRSYLKKLGPEKVDVSPDRCFVGWDAYQRVLDLKDIDLVILATPPGFRPIHLAAAVAAGKHCFVEKPVAVDGPGVRSVMKSCALARSNGLSIVSGLCYRYDYPMRETVRRVHDGAIGRIVALQCTYNTGGLWMVPRRADWTDMEWQVRNWLYFTWLSGDFNVEQHVHSLDKMAWVMKDEYPVRAVGAGGRQVRTAPEYGHIFDHHNVVYEYADGTKLFSACRQQDGCAKDVSDHVFGTDGTCDVMRYALKGQRPWKHHAARDAGDDMYQNEHNEMISGIRAGKPLDNSHYMARSTLMAIMGRMATYTGEVITWEKALHSEQSLAPANYAFGPLPTPAVARPGVTKFA
jgi:predicted dehydrogenase